MADYRHHLTKVECGGCHGPGGADQRVAVCVRGPGTQVPGPVDM